MNKRQEKKIAAIKRRMVTLENEWGCSFDETQILTLNDEVVVSTLCNIHDQDDYTVDIIGTGGQFIYGFDMKWLDTIVIDNIIRQMEDWLDHKENEYNKLECRCKGEDW